jgi:hypothetical protein
LWIRVSLVHNTTLLCGLTFLSNERSHRSERPSNKQRTLPFPGVRSVDVFDRVVKTGSGRPRL